MIFKLLLCFLLVYGICGCPTVIDELGQLKQLNTYANEWPGLYHDHFTTTWTRSTHPNALNRYNFVETLGMVLINNQNCTCAVEVVQMIDEQMGFGGTQSQPGLFGILYGVFKNKNLLKERKLSLGRINHKMALKNNRVPNILENYLLTGEKFYCVQKYGQCGASLPLREWHVEAEYDTIMTTNTSMEGALGVTYKGMLCYIWSANYKAGTSAPLSYQPKVGDSIGLMSIGIPKEPECPLLNTTMGDWTFNSLRKVPGTVATLHCQPNRSPSHGASVIVCQKSYKWMPNPATKCSECKSCTPFKSSQNAEIAYSAQFIEDETEDRDFYPALTTASLICSNNTGISHNGADVSVCTANGWVPDKLGYCEKVCPPFSVKNGQILYTDSQGYDQISTVNGTIATIVCQATARLVNGSGSSICLEGKWSNQNIGNCENPTCRPVEGIKNGRLHYSMISTAEETSNTTLYYPGTTVRLHCNSNYSIHGASESICESQGNWQPKLGYCV